MHVCVPVIVNQSGCGRCHSSRSHSRNEWVVQAAGRVRCAKAELAASLGQTEEVALPWGWDGGRVVVYCHPCEIWFEFAASKPFIKSDYLIICTCPLTLHIYTHRLFLTFKCYTQAKDSIQGDNIPPTTPATANYY